MRLPTILDLDAAADGMNEDATAYDPLQTASMTDPTTHARDDDFERLYRTYKPLLQRIAQSRGLPVSDADDRIHDVFASFILHRADVRDPGSYLMGAIRNASRDYWRSQSAERAVFCEADTSAVKDDCRLDDAVTARASVRAALKALGPSCRETLKRYYLEGESAADIAAERQTSTGYVHRLLHFCRRRAQAFYTSMSGTR